MNAHRSARALAFSLAGAALVVLPVHALRAQSPCELATLVASDGTPGAQFGHHVALHVDTLGVGAPYHEHPGRPGGAVYVFERAAGGTWTQQVELAASDASASDEFGNALAFAGELLVVGAPDRSVHSGQVPRVGAAYVFERRAGGWVELERLLPPLVVADTRFGHTVAIAGDTIFVGAEQGGLPGGAVHVYERAGATWTHAQTLVEPDPHSANAFGSALAARDGRLVVGAPFDDDGGTNTGSAYVYEHGALGWTKTAELHAPDLANGDAFGMGVAVDGARIAIGAWHMLGTATQPGAVYVFDLAAGQWTSSAKLTGAFSELGDNFGGSALELRDGRIAVGAPTDDHALAQDAGSVHVFDLVAGQWIETVVLAPNPADHPAFGVSVALDTHALVAGAYFDSPSGPSSGSVRAFALAHPLDMLSGCPQLVSLVSGGAQQLDVHAGAAHAGEPYLVLGSASGTTPGLALGAFVLPLSVDAYFAFTLAQPNQPPLSGSLGVLDANGGAHASFALGAGSDPALAGVLAQHACVALSPLTLAVTAVSNAVPLALVP